MARKFIKQHNLPFVEEGLPQIKFELFGQWGRAMRIFAKLGPDVKQSSINAQTKVADEIVKRVKGHLRNQDLGWKRLDPDYAARKAEAGVSGKTLMAYKKYYESIKTWTSGSRSLVMIGVKRGIYTRTLGGKRSRLEVATIAALHEFSTGKRLPRRPLWNPTIAEMGGAAGMKKIYLTALVWHLRRRGIPVTKSSSISLILNNQKISPFR